MVQNFTRELSVKLCRYCAHFLHLPLLPILHLFDILLQFTLNHSVTHKLRCVNKSLFKPILLFLCFLGYSKYLVRSVQFQKGYLVTYQIERERFVQIYHLFGSQIIAYKLVVPCTAWDFFFDKHINLTYLTYRNGVVFFNNVLSKLSGHSFEYKFLT